MDGYAGKMNANIISIIKVFLNGVCKQIWCDKEKILGATIAVWWLYGGLNAFIGFLTTIFLSICAYLTDKKSNIWYWGFIFIALAVYFANWFFDDLKKTLSLPLAVASYLLAKRLLPSPIVDLCEAVEARFTVRVVQTSTKSTQHQGATPQKQAKKKFYSFKRHHTQTNHNYECKGFRRRRIIKIK